MTQVMTATEQLTKYPKIYEGKFAEIYDMSAELPGVAFAFWKGFFELDDKQFIQEMHDSIALVKNAGIKIYISDHSLLKIVKEDVLEWIHENWYKGVYKNGLIGEMSIDAQSLFGQLSLKKMLVDTKTGGVSVIKVRNFEEGKKAAQLFLENHI